MADQDLGGAGSTDPATQSNPQMNMSGNSGSGEVDTMTDQNAPADGLHDTLNKTGQEARKEDEYTKQLKVQHQKSVERADHYSHQQQQYIDHFAKSAAAPLPERPQYQQLPPMPTEAKHTATQTVFNVLAVAATAFLLFGTRRNHGSQGALMSGLGELFKGIAQGNHEKVKEDSIKWHQLNESLQAENKSRLQDYKDILANRKLNLGQQMSLIKMHAQFHKDQRLEEAADNRDIAKVQKNLELKQKQIKDHAQRTTGGTMPKALEEQYTQRVLEMTKGQVDYKKDPVAANEVYPASKFYQDLQREESANIKSKTKAEEKQKKDAPATPQDKSAADFDNHINTVFNGETGTSPKMETKTQESVLAPSDSVFTTRTDGQGNQSGL